LIFDIFSQFLCKAESLHIAPLAESEHAAGKKDWIIAATVKNNPANASSNFMHSRRKQKKSLMR
jgi:hypothetical protein